MTGEPTDNAGIRVLPPFYFLTGLVAGYVVWWFWTVPVLPGGWALLARTIGGVAFIAGVGLAGFAIWSFHRLGVSPDPHQPTAALVTDGPYRFSRNPMYLGMALFHGGLALLGNALWPLLTLVPVIWLVRRQIIDKEEGYLEGKFGEPYRAFKTRVRRWF